MKSLHKIWTFLDSKDFESLSSYKEEALHIYYNQHKMTVLDIMHYWNLRFTGASRHSFTAASCIYRFLNAQ